jgi:hypothetical protein
VRSLAKALDVAPEAGVLVRARPWSLKLGVLATWMVHGFVVWVYFWFATDGTFRFAPPYHGYYDELADAFLAGQLHLKRTVAPELLALPDPYDPSQNAQNRLHDASLYDGKWYLYWGPVPGLTQALWKGLTGVAADARAMMLIFGLGGAFWFWLLAKELRDRAFPNLPDRLVLLVYLCYALGGVSLFLQARPLIWHEAVVAGGFFMLAGWYVWLRGLAGGPLAYSQLALAGVLFGCAFGSRMTMIGYGLGAGLVLVWQWASGGRRWSSAGRALAFGLPPMAMLALLLLYNYARFNSLTEFGLTYQLLPFRLVQSFDPGVFSYNLVAYLLYLPEPLWYFPFIQPGDISQLLLPPRGAGVPWGLEQPLVSMLLLAPLTLLIPFAVTGAIPRRGQAPSVAPAFVAAAGIGLLFGLGGLMTWNFVSGRFLHDVLPIAGLLGGLGLWSLRPDRHALRRLRPAYATLSVALAAISIGLGICYGMVNLTMNQSPAYLGLAYRMDVAVSSLVQRVAPAVWPSGYLEDPVKRRPGGIFYPDHSVFDLPAPRTIPARALEIEVLSAEVTRVVGEIDGRIAGEQRVRPGKQIVELHDLSTAPDGRIAVQLHFPEQAPRPAGGLWPLKLGRLLGHRSEQERESILRELWERLGQRRAALAAVEQEIPTSEQLRREQDRVVKQKDKALGQATAALRKTEQAQARRGGDAARAERQAEVDRARAELERAQAEHAAMKERFQEAVETRLALRREITDLEFDLALHGS